MINEIHDISTVKKYVTFDNKPFFELAAQYYKDGMSVLDVGAGRGGFADVLGNPDIYLIDGNPKAVNHLQKNIKTSICTLYPKTSPLMTIFLTSSIAATSLNT